MGALSCDRDCACRDAVLTAYRELTARRCSDRQALRSCTHLYRCHHRGASEEAAWVQVSRWVNAAAQGAPRPGEGC